MSGNNFFLINYKRKFIKYSVSSTNTTDLVFIFPSKKHANIYISNVLYTPYFTTTNGIILLICSICKEQWDVKKGGKYKCLYKKGFCWNFQQKNQPVKNLHANHQHSGCEFVVSYAVYAIVKLFYFIFYNEYGINTLQTLRE